MTREERDNAITILENEKKCVNRANKNDYCNRDCYNCELVKTDTEILTALDMAIKALQEQADNIPEMYYPQVDGITPTVVVQADGEKTCGTCRNEDTYHCAECENKSDYEQSQADGEYISKACLKEAIHTLYQGLKLTRTEDDVQKCIDDLPSVAIPSAEPKTVKSCDTCKHDEAFGCPSFIYDRCENYSEWEQADGEYILKKDVMCCIGQTSVHSELARKLRELPSVAIPSAEPQTGHWKKYSFNWMCDQCNRLVSERSDYCPHCGAKMD